ncbi:MAG: RagB/SusD family nutrient uptake outer membrane protein [Runella sp.]
MKKSIKITISVVCLLLGMVGCQERLEEVRPETTLDPNAILADASSAYALYNGVYASLRSYQANLFLMGEMRSEIWANGLFTESEEPTFRQFWGQDFNAANAPLNNWGGFYSLLNRVNTVIKLFPKAPLDAASRNRYRGEMFGLRAYIYYTMLRTWGDVPLTTTPIEEIGDLTTLYKERSPAADVMRQIKADIDSSMAIIGNTVSYATPANPNNTKRVYWNRAATLTLKGDVYSWSATHFNGGNADLNTAKAALEEVRTNPLFGLQANYADVFDPLKETGNREIIFALSYERDQAGLGSYANILVNTTQRATLIFDPTTPTTIVSVYPFVAGASRVGLSQAMITRLSSTTPVDTRIRNTFRTMHNNTAPFALRGIMFTKFIGRADPISSSQIYDTDFPIYRYADVLLLLAEVKTKLGESPKAEIDAIRQRAYGAGFTPFVSGSTTANMDAVLEEDLREFIGEGRRWWTLRRAGDAFVYKNINPAYLTAAQSHKLLLPITVSMLNSDPKLKQTPGY